MVVVSGYKQTDVGVVPEDWDTPELSSILQSVQLGGNYKNSEHLSPWPLIKMGNLGRGGIRLDKLEYVEGQQAPFVRDKLEVNDVLLNTRNTLDLVGKVANEPRDPLPLVVDDRFAELQRDLGWNQEMVNRWFGQ